MALNLPRLPRAIKIIEAAGTISVQFQNWWQTVVEALEANAAQLEEQTTINADAIAAIQAAQAAADAANAAATAATTAANDAAAAATTANNAIVTIQSDIVALDSRVDALEP